MAPRGIVCPLCRGDDVEGVANIPAIVLGKCRTCATAFTVAAPVQPDAHKERPGT
jgi:hypothetical protein